MAAASDHLRQTGHIRLRIRFRKNYFGSLSNARSSGTNRIGIHNIHRGRNQSLNVVFTGVFVWGGVAIL